VFLLGGGILIIPNGSNILLIFPVEDALLEAPFYFAFFDRGNQILVKMDFLVT
jgi:hypothetical protein